MTALELRPGRHSRDAQDKPAGSAQSPVSHTTCDDQLCPADGTQSAGSYAESDAHVPTAASIKLLDGHGRHVARTTTAVEVQTPSAARGQTCPNNWPRLADPQLLDGHVEDEAHARNAVEVNRPLAAAPATIPVPPSRLADIHLALLAESLDDMERTRIAAQNRHRSLCQVYGLDGTPEAAAAAGFAEALAALEHQTILRLNRVMRAHPLGPWLKTQRGIGEKQGARLLAAIGDPYWNTLHDRPRTVSELWAYCGLHVLPASHVAADTHTDHAGGDQTGNPDHLTSEGHAAFVGVAAKRRKGQKANWSATAKMRAYLIATSCMKQPDGSQFRDIYTARRAHTAETHPDWTPGHSHNDGLRIVAKAVLKELWIAARELHGQTSGQPAEERRAS